MSKIPQTDSIAELARFWDTHDLTDFESELVEVTEPVFERSEKILHISLHSRQASALHRSAMARTMSDDELAKEWLCERLRISRQRTRRAKIAAA